MSVGQFAVALAGFVTLVLVGTLGFWLFFGDGPLEALDRTVSTATGAGMVSLPNSTGGKLFTLVLMLGGIVVFFYSIALITELVVGGILSGLLQRRRMTSRIGRLEGHYIVCGYGRVGRSVADELAAAGRSLVVVDANPDALARAEDERHTHLAGDGADDEVLRSAGIERAAGLVACADDDATNTFVVLTAKGLRPDLRVIARASSARAVDKLERAGADRVVSPYATAGRQIAGFLTRPQVAALLELATSDRRTGFQLEEIAIPESWPDAGRSLADLAVRDRTGALVIAVRRADGSLESHPRGETQLARGDVVIGAGLPDQVTALEELLR